MIGFTILSMKRQGVIFSRLSSEGIKVTTLVFNYHENISLNNRTNYRADTLIP